MQFILVGTRISRLEEAVRTTSKVTGGVRVRFMLG